MTFDYDCPDFAPPHRAIVLIGAIDAWWQASPRNKQAAMSELADVLTGSEPAATLLASVDDDYFMTGQPNSMLFSMYLTYEVTDPAALVRMVHQVRSSQLGRYFRMEVRLGRQLFLVDR